MPTPSGHTDAIRASRVIGTTVYNTAGENMGTIEDVMLEKTANDIMFAVIGFGGFLGIGDRHYPLPWEKLTYDTNMGGFVVDLDRRMIEGAPSYTDESTASWEDPTWGKRVYEYYGAHPYW